MSHLNEILNFNKKFVENKEYKTYETSKFPNKRTVILTCMDTRLVELLPKAMNIHNGDVKIIKDAGAVICHPFGSVMRSIIVAIYELQADEVLVIGHKDCGMTKIDPDKTIDKFKNEGITDETIDTLLNAGIDLHKWLEGFDDVSESVKNSVDVIRNHPLIPSRIPVHGLVIDPATGELELVDKGY